MLEEKIERIILEAKAAGWVLEPKAKEIFAASGLPVPRFKWVVSVDEACSFAEEVGYPVVVKIVSPKVIHKSDVGGVVTGVSSEKELREAYTRLSRITGFKGVLIDETVTGVELIMGAKNDAQFCTLLQNELKAVAFKDPLVE